MAIREIPLSPEAQSFFIDLAGTTYLLKLQWNEKSQSWILDVGDNLGSIIVAGIPADRDWETVVFL